MQRKLADSEKVRRFVFRQTALEEQSQRVSLARWERSRQPLEVYTPVPDFALSRSHAGQQLQLLRGNSGDLRAALSPCMELALVPDRADQPCGGVADGRPPDHKSQQRVLEQVLVVGLRDGMAPGGLQQPWAHLGQKLGDRRVGRPPRAGVEQRA